MRSSDLVCLDIAGLDGHARSTIASDAAHRLLDLRDHH